MCYFFIIFVIMFEIKLKNCVKNCNTLNIKEVIGFYDEELNPTGWGTPNIEKSDVTKATLFITTPTGQIFEEDVIDTIKDSVFSSYTLFDFTPIEDGIYTVKLVIETESQDHEVIYNPRIWCNVACCVDKLSLKLAEPSCNPCGHPDLDKINLAFMLLKSLESGCLSDSEFNKILSQLKKICESSGCGCGCS